MIPSPTAFSLIKHEESCSLEAYPDPGTGADPWTIGWGATGTGICKGTIWTQEQADARLEEDVMKVAAGVTARLAGAPTTQNQFDALVSLAYNIGLVGLGNSTLLRLHKAGKFAQAAAEFAKWNHSRGVVLPGLTTRRALEAAVYRGAPWP